MGIYVGCEKIMYTFAVGSKRIDIQQWNLYDNHFLSFVF